MIAAARTEGGSTVNTTPIQLYLSIGEDITRKIAADDWEHGTVSALAVAIQRQSSAMGRYAQNRWRIGSLCDLPRPTKNLGTAERTIPNAHLANSRHVQARG
jgi:hypothetical protein